MPFVACPNCGYAVSAAQVLRTNRCIRCDAVVVPALGASEADAGVRRLGGEQPDAPAE